MGQIGVLTTGAGVTTIIPGQAQCEALIMLGDVDTTFPLQGVTIEVDGSPFFNVQSATLLAAYAKWMMNVVGTVIGIVLKVATGMMPRNTTYRLTNAGATTPAIFAWSDNDNGVPFLCATKQINALSYEDFRDFSALFVATPANVSNYEIVFSNGSKKTFAPVEMDAYFALQFPAEANGQLAGITVIDNRDQKYSAIRINCSAVNTILVAKVPDAAFRALNR
jgi:hypothetical protein